jgi:glycosyltransferase involved in cell wall biosynthesis
VRVPESSAMPRRLPRVAVDARALVPQQPTGIGLMTLALLREMSARGRLELTALAHRPLGSRDELESLGVRVIVDPAPLGVIWQQWRLPGRLRRGNFDVLWGPLFTSPWFCPVPSVLHVHDLTAALLPQLHTLKHRLSLLPFLRRSLRGSSRIVTVSEATARDLRRYAPECSPRITVIPCGIDGCFEPADAASVHRIRTELDCPNGYLFSAGTLEPRKNLIRVLDAYEALLDRETPLPPLLVAGAAGWKQRDLSQRLTRLASRGVRQMGYVSRERLVELMQAATAFVYPSLYEGFGLPVAEAMACGVPVLTSNTSSLPEVVGDAGLCVDPTDTGAIEEAMERLVSDAALRQRLITSGLERVRRFNWPEAAQKLEALLCEVCPKAEQLNHPND